MLVLISLVLVLISVHLFASELEAVSAARALRDEDRPRRYLELGWTGRLVIAAIPAIIIGIVILIKRWYIPSTIVVLILAVCLSAGYILLKLRGFGTLKSWALLYFAVTWAGMNRDMMYAGNMSVWTIVWSVLISIITITTIGAAIILRGYDPDEDDDTEDKTKSVLGKIVKIIVLIAVLVLLFVGAYQLCQSFIVPKLS